MRKILLSTLFAAVFALCPAAAAQVVRVKGSDTLLPLAQRWAQEYQKKNDRAHLTLYGGGSASGIAALLTGNTDIAESSRPMSNAEKDELKKQRKSAVDLVIAADAVEILVNPANTVSSLTMDQVRGIFTGTITNWKEVGGVNESINLYGRDSLSGTHAFLQEHALQGRPYAATVKEFPMNSVMVAAVLKDKGGICYAGLSPGRTLKHLSIKVDTRAEAVEPTPANVRLSKYPLSRQLHWYLSGRPTGLVRALCIWVLSPEAQLIAEAEGFIPISAETRSTDEGYL